MPSDSETLGFVVIESMASGVPVVGARAGGIPNIIKDGKTGLLCNPRDAEDFNAKVKSLLDDRSKLSDMAKAAYEDTQLWGWESATSYLRNVQYQRAIDNYDVQKEEKIEKMLQIAARLCYYCYSTYWAIQISYGQPWMPSSLGGSGTDSYFPLDPYVDNHGLRNYVLTMVGFQVGVMIKAMLDGRMLSMWQPLMLAVLYGSSYIVNQM